MPKKKKGGSGYTKKAKKATTRASKKAATSKTPSTPAASSTQPSRLPRLIVQGPARRSNLESTSSDAQSTASGDDMDEEGSLSPTGDGTATDQDVEDAISGILELDTPSKAQGTARKKRKRADTDATIIADTSGKSGPSEEEEVASDDASDSDEDGSEEDEDEDDEDEDEEEVLDIAFWVPDDGAVTTVTLKETTSWWDFCMALDVEANVDPEKTKIAYRFSTQLRSAPYQHVRDRKQYAVMMEKAAAAFRQHKSGRGKKDFAVELKVLEDEKASSSKAKDKDKRKKKKKKTSDSDSSGSDGDLDGEKIKNKKKSATQWVAILEKDNACPEHDGRACVKFADFHHQLTKQDLGLWAVFMTQGYASTTTPPKGMKISDQKPVSKA
ncbi:hypothetical protein D9611_007599 [Ephemerocybe angulata]|uniref:Uncharacterized protein n=1 Tax=Ephemerocybe angulata TaxID=980116 RepID=A0A8H5FCL7_9AGAR|nr:hypothetical protein D9611_007599 [Tulosesus angulatus]